MIYYTLNGTLKQNIYDKINLDNKIIQQGGKMTNNTNNTYNINVTDKPKQQPNKKKKITTNLPIDYSEIALNEK